MKKVASFIVFAVIGLCIASMVACHVQKQTSCVFCSIIARNSPAIILDENEYAIAFEKNPPRIPVDCLIIPKKHIKNVKDLDLTSQEDKNILDALFAMAQKLSKKLTGTQDFQLHINNGTAAGQTVPHLHMHFKSPEQWKQ